MGVVIPFPVHRSRASNRARRIFQAQVDLERAQRQALAFFAMANLCVMVLMTTLEIASRLR